jgi:hypothetical protein
MDSDALVEQQIDDGQKLIEKAVQHRFDVTAAFWLKASNDGKWRFYLVAPAVDADGLASAYRQLHPVVYAPPRVDQPTRNHADWPQPPARPGRPRHPRPLSRSSAGSPPDPLWRQLPGRQEH